MDGLEPASEALHETFLDVEPITGACFSAHQRLQVRGLSPCRTLPRTPYRPPPRAALTPSHPHVQINTFVQGNPLIHELANVTLAGVYVPLMWADETATATQSLVDQFNGQVHRACTPIRPLPPPSSSRARH